MVVPNARFSMPRILSRPYKKLAPKQQLLLFLIPIAVEHVVLVLEKAKEGPRLYFVWMREDREGKIQKLLAASFNKIIDIL